MEFNTLLINTIGTTAPKISVIIPTYIPKEYMFDCLCAIKQQNIARTEFEIIIILNGCADPYSTRLIKYLSENFIDYNIALFHTNISGVSNARNIGIDQSRGKYLVFIDDDDIISPKYLSGLLKYANKETVVFSNIKAFSTDVNTCDDEYIFTQTYNKLHDTLNPSLFDIRHLLNGPWGKLFPKSVIKNIIFDTNIHHGEDALFCFKISRNVKFTAFADENCIYYYRDQARSYKTNVLGRKYWINNRIDLLIKYSKTFFHNPLHYNFKLYLCRVLSISYSLLRHIIKDN